MNNTKQIFLIVITGLIFYAPYSLYSQDRAKHEKLNDNEHYISSGFSLGLGESSYSNSLLNSKSISYHASIGLFPFCLSFTHSKEISNIPETEQSDLYLNIIGGLAGYGLYAFLPFGAGISFGTVRKENDPSNFTQTENFVLPLFAFEPEFGIELGNHLVHFIGIKWSYLLNKKRSISSYSLSYRILIPI